MNYMRKESVYRRPAFLLATLAILVAGLPARAANLVQDFYLPMPEAQISQANGTIISGTAGAISSTFSIVVTGDGTVIYYDQWEDGYEVDLGNPVQSTTKIWGDGNDAHGIPPGFAHNPLGLPAGTVITLTNSVPLPRNPSQILWDARDHVAANKALVISRAGWPTSIGPVFAGAAGVLSTMDYGTNYISPVGQDLAPNLFKYVGMFILAAQNNTAITIDPNGNGVGTTNIVLNQGESYLVNGGVKKGGRVTATKPIQADLVIGHVGSSYASDWFTLYPVSSWDNSYYTAVGSAASGSQPAYVYLFNPATNAITINYTTRAGSGSFVIPGTNGVYQFQMPVSSGASFISAGGQNFFAICTVAANNSADTSYNWGFTLVPKAALTTKGVVGWGPGSADGTVNGSPVWVTSLANTTVYVDYKGDHAGPLAYTNGGNIIYYDTNFTVSALQTLKVYDPSKNQTGMQVFTVDGTLLTAAWGEDPDVASPGNPYIDAGTTVIPFPTPVLFKSVTNLSSSSGLHIGDTLQYSVQVDNKGLLPLGNTVVIDTPTTNLTYVTNSTTWNGTAIADNSGPYSATNTAFPLDGLGSQGYTIPVILSQGSSTFIYQVKVNAAGSVSNSVNIGGTTIFAQTVVPTAIGASVTLNFTDTNGVPIASYLAGAKIFVTMTNAVGNSSSNTIQTLSVTVTDTNTGDAETIPLVETGTNTGVFRNVSGLPSSSISGLVAQDGTLYVTPGNTLGVSYTDPVYGDSASTTAVIQIPTPNKQLYLTASGVSGNQFLNRVNPALTANHGTTYNSIDIGSGGGSGVVSVDAYSTNTTGNSAMANTLTISHTTGAGANRLMLVAVGIGASADTSSLQTNASTVTYNGVNLTRVGTVIDGYSTPTVRSEIWQLTNPPSGTFNVVITLTNSQTRPIVGGVMTFTGVNLANPLGAYGGSSCANSTSPADQPSVTNSTASGELVFGTCVIDGDGSGTPPPALTPSPGQTTYIDQTALYRVRCAVTTKPGSASTPFTNGWTYGSSQQWACCAVAIKPAAGGGGGPATNTTSFAQTPALALPFTLPVGGAVSITNFIAITNGVGNFTGNLNITATLQTNGVNFLTLTNPAFTASGGVTNLVWTGTLAANYTLPVNTVITYVVTNNIANTAFHVIYDSTNSPSQIVLPASTVIAFSGFAVYDAPYNPGGNLVSTPIAGTTVYVRATVTDPFGSYDITSLGLAFTAPNTNNNFSVMLNDTSVVFTNASTKTYEYAWNTGPATGGYTVAATANEGTEGVKANATAGITTIYLDLGTPSVTEFTSGNNGSATNAYLANSNVCVRVTDLNRNTNAATVETIAATIRSSFGDVENLTLTETGTNTGVFTGCINSTTNTGTAIGNGTTLVAPVGNILTVNYSDPTDPTDNTSATATIQPLPGIPGIVMNKTIVSPTGGQVGVGKPVVYNLQVVNVGSTLLTNVSITDTFTSARLSFTSASVAPNVTNATTLTWTNLGVFAPGQSTNLTVNFTTLATGTATNSATAGSTSVTNSASVTIAVNSAALNVVKTLLSPTNSPVSVGSNVVFRLTFQNVGNTVITYLPFEDNFSGAYFQYVSATIPANGSGYGSLIWTNIAGAGLATNAIITNDVTMTVVGAGNPANNTAVVDYATDIFGNPVPTATGSTNVVTAAASITGHVYNDKDQSGTLTAGDTGLGSVTLRLFTDPNGDGNPADGTLVQSTTTDVNGYYEFLNLPAGHYDVIVQDRPPGFASVTPTGNQLSVNLPTLTASTNNNFFDYQPSATLYSTINGTVYNDLNGGGTNYAGIAGLAYVTVELFQDVNTNGVVVTGDPIMGSTTTDANGNYSFAAVSPGHYVIRETDFYGYYSTGNSQTPNDNQISFVSTNGITSGTNNFFDRLSPVAVVDTNSALYFVATVIRPLTNDLSPNGDALTISNAVSTNGIVVINPGSTNLTFTPTNLGATIITYAIADAHGGTSTNSITVNVIALADLAIGKTGAASVFAASNLVYTISVTNLGPTPASSVVVTDALPAGVSFVNASGGGANNSGVVTWTLGSLTSGQITNLILTVTSPASGTLTNTANVSSPTPDPTLTNNVTPPVVTTVTPVADLAIAKSANASVLAASNLVYTISVTNLGPSTASSVVVTDTLPASVSFVSASGNGVNNSGTVSWALGSMTNGQTTNLTLIVTAPASGTLTNVANVASPTGDPNSTNSTTPAVITTVTPVADLAVGKTGVASGVINTSFNYTISVTNLGPSAAASFSVTDSLPAGMVFVSSLPATVTNAANQAIWNVGSLAANAVTNFTLTVQTASRATFTNVATAGGPTLDPAPTNNASAPVVTSITNRPPVAVADSAASARNVAVTIPVLANDSDPDGDTVTIFSVSPTNGTFSLSGGSIIYTPTNTVPATNVFTYTISDGFGGTATASVTVAVTNRPPVAANDAAGTTENASVTVPVLVNDSDPDGDALTIISTSPTNGIASISGTNVVFTPATNFTGTATCGYGIRDNFGGTNFAVITITVTNIPPTANPDSYAITENTTNSFAVLVNDVVNTSGGSLALLSVSTTNGTANVSGTNIVFTPATNYRGTLTLNYTIIDNIGGTNSTTVAVTVTNIPPLANPDNFAVRENSTNTFSPLLNDTLGTPGGTLSIIAVAPTNGTAVVSGTNITFTPTANFLGTATIGYTITDGIGGTNASLITVTVTNIPPVAAPDNYSVRENSTNTFSPVINDTVQTPGGTLALVAVNPTNGTAVISGTNVIFTPTPNFLGVATIGYTITDGIGGTNSALITVTVTNIPPVANPDNFAITENTTNSFAVLVNDSVQTPGGSLTLLSVSTTNGTSNVSGTNIVFTPATNYRGALTLNCTIVDNIGGTNSTTVTVTVTNIPPLANPDGYTVLENSTNIFAPLTNDVVRTPGGALQIIGVSPTNGTANILNLTNIVFTPSPNFVGTATVGYTITDGIGGTNSSVITVTVQSVADLAVSKSGPATVYAATNYSYTITITNLGPGVAANLSVTDNLPAAVSFVSSTAGATLAGSQLVWTNLGSLAANAATNLTVTVTAPVTGVSLTNLASAGSPTSDPNPTNNTSPPVVTAVTPVADLMIAKAGPASVLATSNVLYTISVTNFGPSSASSVVVTDALPAGVSFVSASGNGVNNFGVVSWNLGTLANGAVSNLTVTVTAPASGSLTNIASVSSPTTDTNVLNNTTPPVVTTVGSVADLAIGKSAPASVFAVSNLTYTISVTNFGPSTASSVTVTDNIPNGASFVNASGGGANNSGTVIWNLGDLPKNTVSNLTLTVTAPASGTLTNVATVGSPTGEPNATNNTTPPVLTSVTPLADLVIAKVGPATVFAASNLSYTISVTNLGPSSASGVVVTDTLPNTVSFVSASGNGTNNSGVVTWNLGTLANGAASNLTLTVTAPASGSLTNIASVGSPTGDTNILNNTTPPVITAVTLLADVSVVKFGPAGILFGTNFNYTITVSNAGPSTAASLSVTDSLPTGLAFISAVPATTTNTSNQVIWNLGNFAAGTGSNLTLTVISTLRGSLTNFASGGSPTSDPNPTNNTAPPVVTAVTNNPPVANPDHYVITENTTNTFSPLLNDTVQTPGGALQIIGLNPTNGTATILNLTNVVFTPSLNFFGTATIGYIITDGVGGTNSSVITVLVTNIPPTANPDSYAITENTTNVFAVLPNDFVNTLGGSLALLSVSTTNGTANVIGTNLVFTPAANYRGTLTLDYSIVDNIGGTNSSFVTVLVTNIPPIANPDSYTVPQNSTNTLTPLVNDFAQTPGGALQIIGVSPTNGTANILNLTNIIFTPTSNFVGTANVGYTITDGIGGTNLSIITVTVSNLPPTANAQSVSTPQNTALPITLTGSDPANFPLNFVIMSSPAGGTLTGLNTNTGAVTYTPTNNFSGTDTFTFRVNNGHSDSATATVTVTVSPVADLLVAQSGPAIGVAGANLVFTVAVTNLGPAGATNVVVTNQIDSGYTFVSASDNGATNGNLVTWTIPVLPANGATNFTVTLFAVEGGTFTNTASGISTTPDLALANNDGSLTNAQAITTVSALADVAVFKTGTTSVLAGGIVNYSIVATNFGPSTASNVVVRDTLPAGATLQTASGNYSVSNNVIIWSAATLAGGAATNFIVTLTAPDSGTLTNIASSISDTADPNPGNNDGSSPSSVVATPVTLVADLSIGKSAAASVLATSNLIYTISVTNLGPSTASSVTVTDAVPAGATFANASGSFANNSGMVIWNLGDLASGAVSNVTLTVTPPTSGSLTNTATVGSPTGDPNSTNNVTPPVVTIVTPVADIAVGKSGPIGATFNTNFSYTISVTNFGPSATSGILVTDTLPAGVVFASAVPATTTNSIGQVIWSVGNLAANATTNLTLTVVSTARGTVTNFAAVGAPTLDPSPTNNLSQPVVTLVTNIPPVANADSYVIAENSGTNTFTPLLNDTVRNPGGVLQIISVNTTNGSAAVSGTNVLFVPGTNYFGSLTIGYTITDNMGGTNSSVITVLVTNIPPTANPDNYTIGENSGTNTFSPLLNDVLHTPGGTLQIIGVSPTNGTASISGTNILFKPNTNFFGTATIGYTITDGIGGTNSSVITVTVTNIPPVANGLSVGTTENTAVQITLTGSDPNGLPLKFAIVGNPANGTLTGLNTNTGVVTYVPGTNYTGADSFTFRVNNGQTNSAAATVSLTVTPVVDLVVVQSGPVSGVAGSNLVFTVSVTNRGPATATGVAITNQLASGFTFFSASGSGANSGNLVTWSFASLSANGVTNFTVTAFATEGGTFTNIASGASVVLDLNATNNSGSLTNAWSRTTVSALADVQVFKDGGTNVYAGQPVDYTIIATNAGPSTATSVVVQDNLPSGATFQSASGSYVLSNGVVKWSGVTLAPGATTTFTLTLVAPASVSSFQNIALATSPVADPNPTNNNGSLTKSRVTTKVAPSADVVVVLNGPASAIQGSNFVYTISVTNTGPSTSSNLITSDTLPPGLTFVSASSGGTTNGSNVVTWPAVVALPVGGVTNYSVTVRSTTSGDYTNIVSEVATTYDPNATNNSGVLPASRVRTTVAPAQFTFLAGSPVFNPQTGLFEETVTVTNNGSITVLGFRLNIGGLRSGVSLWNANGTNNGVPYINYNFPLDPSNATTVVLEFFDPTRLPFTNTVSIEVITPANLSYTGTNGSVAVSRVFLDTRLTNDPRFVIEFASTPGKTYAVIYSGSLTGTNWLVATPSVKANANVTQWYDDGPPKTISKPTSVLTRFYRVIQY